MLNNYDRKVGGSTLHGSRKKANAARVMFVYWGRSGAFSRFAHGLHAAALADDAIHPTLSVSKNNGDFPLCESFRPSLFPVETFASGVGAAAILWRVGSLGHALMNRIGVGRIEAVISLMPHVWTGFMIPFARKAGAKFVTIVHDASAHPGDPTALVHQFLLREARHADHVITLSAFVASQLAASRRIPEERITALFHPDIDYGAAGRSSAPPLPSEPFRLLFLGRIMPYKGLGLLIDAAERLRAQGVGVALSVCGDGPLARYKQRLGSLQATVVNRWLTDGEIAAALSRHHAVALPYLEASQSGVAAAAFGAGVPVIATPVGGLREQVWDGFNGVLAQEATAEAYAGAIRRLAVNQNLLLQLQTNLASSDGARSMQRFVKRLVSAALPQDSARAAASID